MHYDPNEKWDEFLLEVAVKRKASGLTHKDLADSSGMVERSITRLLTEPTKNPSLFLVAAICQALHISLDKYFVPSVYNKGTDKGTDRLTDDVEHKAEIIELLKNQERQHRKFTMVLVAIIGVLLTLMILYLVLIDARNLDYGLIRG